MRIGILTNYHLRQVGGAEAAIDRVATAWHEARHDVCVMCCPEGRGANERPWDPPYQRVDLERPRSTRFSLGAIVRRMAAAHAVQTFDVILACDIYWAGHVARCFWQRTGVPFVIWSQGSDVMHGSRFVKKPLVRHRMQRTIRDAQGVVGISQYMRRQIYALAQPTGIERIIPNGWPDEWQDAAIPPQPVTTPYLFGMGRLIRLKGFQTLVEAYARLRARHPTLGLVIAGDGAYRETLIVQAKSLGLPVTTQLPTSPGELYGACFPGVVHGETKRGLASHALLGVCPSIRQEPMALVLFEMLSCGTPVVASNVGGSPDVVMPEVSGDLFTAGDIGGLTKCLDELLRDPARIERLRQTARASVAPYRWSQLAAAHLELLTLAANGASSLCPRAA